MARRLRPVELDFVETAPLRLVLRLGRAALGRAFKDAVRSLDRRLARAAGS